MDIAKLNGWQMFTLTFTFVIGTTFLLLPSALIVEGKQYGWLVEVGATLYGIALAAIWLYLSKLHPGLSLVQISLQVMGKWFGGFIAILYIFLFTQVASWITRNMSDYMSINLMPRTPVPVFNIMVLIVCAYAVVKGIRPIALVSALLTPILTIAFWIPYTMMIKEWNWNRFNLNNDVHLWSTFLHTKYAFAFPYMETISFLMLLPFIEHEKVKKWFLIGIGVAGSLLSISIFFTIGILGVYRSSHLVYPIYTIFSEMRFSSLIEHLEAIISVVVLLLVFLKLSILFYCAVLATCQLLNLQDRAIVAYPFIWVISAMSLYFNNIVNNIEWVQKYLFEYYSLYAIIIPSMLIVVSWIRRKKSSSRRDFMT